LDFSDWQNAVHAAAVTDVMPRSLEEGLHAGPPDPPRIHVDDAARQTLTALEAPPGLTIVADDRATRDHSPS
jgi:hypothetical protein